MLPSRWSGGMTETLTADVKIIAGREGSSLIAALLYRLSASGGLGLRVCVRRLLKGAL
jgi:hypothetical protein